MKEKVDEVEEIMSEETMKDFEEEINRSMQRYAEGDLVRGTVLSVEEEEIEVDLNAYSQGIIYREDYSDDPSFHAMDEIRTGDFLEAVVMEPDDGTGRVRLSLKQARSSRAWETLREAMDSKSVYEVKVLTSVNAGVVAFLEGIRGFIPASLLSMSYVEDVDAFVGETLRVIVITADEEKNKLVLSAKDVQREEAAKAHEAKLNALQKGFVTEGVIERIEPYGCFVTFGDGLTGLVHISQICGKFLRSPNEVVKLGQSVKVKVLDVADGKIRLSMKEAEDISPEVTDEVEESVEYSSGEEATTSLGSLLAGLKLDS